MPKLTPAEAAEKWGRNLKASTPDIRRGIERVTEAPGVKAAAAADKMKARLLESIDNGKWARRVASVSLGEWKRQSLEKGMARLSSGVDAANGKSTDFFAELFPYQESLQSKISNMPDVSLDDSINRAVEWMRGMSKFERTR